MGRGTASRPAHDLSRRELPGLGNEDSTDLFYLWNTAAVSHFGHLDLGTGAAFQPIALAPVGQWHPPAMLWLAASRWPLRPSN